MTIIDFPQPLKELLQGRQHNRILRMSFPRDDGPGALMLANSLDAFEALSRDFHFNVEVLSDNAHIELKDVQGKMVCVELVREDGSMRYFNGYVFEFRLVRTDGSQAYYAMTLKPWMAYLHLRHDNYLFHDQTLTQQTTEICRDYKLADWQIRVSGPDEPMTDACQFDETDHNTCIDAGKPRGGTTGTSTARTATRCTSATTAHKLSPLTARRPTSPGKAKPVQWKTTPSGNGPLCGASCRPRSRSAVTTSST